MSLYPLSERLTRLASESGGAFAEARGRAEACLSRGGRSGIGLMGEKLVHLTLKYYIEPLEICHEVPVGGYVADIKNAAGVIEIQTGGLSSMKRKLGFFLDFCPVTVVYPAVAGKYISWIDPATGECSEPRKSPKEAGSAAALRELYGLRDMLGRLTVRVVLLDVAEYRMPSPRGGRGRGSRRAERYPLRLRGDIILKQPRDYLALMPEGLSEGGFTAAGYARAAGLSGFGASLALGTLRAAGAVTRPGKEGRAFVYERV
ncbi:MAG: hypothetical protein FWH06_03775 [Oscillospiraceae bacterium]|nr:hypothetical protein [Oscillospiraceae bacterium]